MTWWRPGHIHLDISTPQNISVLLFPRTSTNVLSRVSNLLTKPFSPSHSATGGRLIRNTQYATCRNVPLTAIAISNSGMLHSIRALQSQRWDILDHEWPLVSGLAGVQDPTQMGGTLLGPHVRSLAPPPFLAQPCSWSPTGRLADWQTGSQFSPTQYTTVNRSVHWWR